MVDDKVWVNIFLANVLVTTEEYLKGEGKTPKETLKYIRSQLDQIEEFYPELKEEE